MSTENKAQFDEISSAMAYEHAVKNHPNKEVIPLIDWQYVHTWWRKGAKWQFDAAQLEISRLRVEISDLHSLSHRMIKYIETCGQYEAAEEFLVRLNSSKPTGGCA